MTDQVIVSTAFDKLNSMLRQEKQEGLRLVVCVEEEFRKFFNQMLAIREVLEDAESRQIDDLAVGYWLHKLKYKFYDIEEMFDEWTTAIQKLRPEELEDTGERRYSTLMRKIANPLWRPFQIKTSRFQI
ncbi:putative disease resistance protein RGA1 [Pistacia vera]|uniref:putative disease resistance protein RGA1 n=1 Tax=Pistacia vera TaxID=55513 RepID=UPI001263CC26|nr:putative disease resistance protein RGA1 [Pistacia vera]